MSKYLSVDTILLVIAKFFSLLLMAVPVKSALGIGRLFGSLAYYVNYRRSKVAYSNMRAAFCEEKSPSQLRRIVKEVYRNFGQTLVEVLMIPKMDTDYMEKYVRVDNRDNFDRAASGGRGIVFLTGHFGNWELSSIVSASKGFPLLVLAREQKMKRLNDALNALRESKGCTVVKKGMATREIYEHLHGNGTVGILADQDAGKKGTFVNFFGRPTSMPRGVFVLARKTGAVIIPSFMIRIGGAHHRLVLESPMRVTDPDESEEVVVMQEFAAVLERYVREYPEQWLWLHKRWKSSPLRKVVILNDGKRGHLNQSLAIFEKIKECRRNEGYSDRDIQLSIVDARYKTKSLRTLLTLLCSFIANYSALRMRSLKKCLSEESYERLEKSYADIVISCGSETTAVNIIFAKENNAKNAIIMKPSLVSSSKFNLALIPEHDNPPNKKNIMKMLGTPNLITRERMEDDLRSLEKTVDLAGRRSIGLLIGGENKNYTFDTSLIREVLDGVISAAEELDANILATTSRRTGGEIDNFVKKYLPSKTGLAKLVIIANEENPEWAVGGILGASDIVIVSGESSSMLSEAASSGKHVIVFKPRKKADGGGSNRHEHFVNRLQSFGIASISEANELKENILRLANSDEKPKRLDNNERILEAVKRII